MFEGLKKKFSSFVNSLSKKEEEKVEEEAKETQIVESKSIEEQVLPKPSVKEQEIQKEEPKISKTKEPEKYEKPTIAKPKELKPQTEPQKIVEKSKEPRPIQNQSAAKVGISTKIKSVLVGKVKISENDVEPFIEKLHLELLQSDVNYEAAEKILSAIKRDLTGKTIESRNIETELYSMIKNSILSVLMKSSNVDLLQLASNSKNNGETPFKILFIGPNGAGKTTTMAKIAEMFMENNLTCLLSASDTFRAAAIEQTAIHAQKLGIEVVKGAYGSDPSSIAFDAIAHAKARGIDVVLIDSAGRQETNKSLIEELKKMNRVAKPNLKLFVGESITGNSLLEQVKEFNNAIGIDGIILTKLDCDAKGGNTLSILSETSIPILYFGTGEGYNDLIRYDPNFIINNIFPN
ncbi:MAG: signal recognition particle-docking protein FtsY [Candidatus Marsarchaeota archaeon]|jgi:fused signal recognition particle receptor|nr:signal recognition particle-docking protein FtsY [Candidatus Marsarchaeota archaeon]